jgi:cytochrome c553
MEDDRLYAWSNPWFRWSVVSLVVLTVLSFLVGFVVLPSVQSDYTAGGFWASICRAAGLPANWGAASTADKAGQASTAVVLAPAMALPGSSEAVGRGATIALQQCSMCHGVQGMSEADAPNLAGQYPEVVIKQLEDYKGGNRIHAFMMALARNLSDRDIADIAAYYDSLPARARHPRDTARPRRLHWWVGDRCATSRLARMSWRSTMARRAVARRYAQGLLVVQPANSKGHATQRQPCADATWPGDVGQEIGELADFYARGPKGEAASLYQRPPRPAAMAIQVRASAAGNGRICMWTIRPF